VSVTDRCNFRCSYCMPKERFGADFAFLEHREILTFEEIRRLVGLFTGLGVEKVRLTGGEPLLRKDLPGLVAQLASLPTLEELTLTTNGVLLPNLARPLREAGLARVTVSLDALDPDRFQTLSGARGSVEEVLAGLRAASRAGFRRIKLNCVLRRGVNEADILPLAAFAREEGHILRFIEFMDVGTRNGWLLEAVVPWAEVAARIGARWPIEPMGSDPGVARRWRYLDGGGELGFVSSVSQPFCEGCDRARLSAEGRLYTCLFAAEGLDLKGPLRAGASDEALVALIRSCWMARGDRYSQLRTEATEGLPRVEMNRMGG
jgi:GTP 3',8-cyclase